MAVSQSERTSLGNWRVASSRTKVWSMDWWHGRCPFTFWALPRCPWARLSTPNCSGYLLTSPQELIKSSLTKLNNYLMGQVKSGKYTVLRSSVNNCWKHTAWSTIEHLDLLQPEQVIWPLIMWLILHNFINFLWLPKNRCDNWTEQIYSL